MIAQKFILGYSSKLLVQFIQIVVSIVIARIAGPTVVGTVAFGLAFVSVFSFIADLGIGSAHIKLVSEGKDLGKCLSTFSVIKISLTVLFFLVVIGALLIQKYIFHVEFKSLAHEYVIFIFLITITLQQLLGIPKVTFAARIEQAKYNIPDLIRTVFAQILRIIVVLLGFRAIALASASLISTIAVIPIILLLFRGYPFSNFDRGLAKQYFKISLPVMVMGISTMVILYLDRIMLQYYTNAEQVGYYAAGYKIGSLVLMIASSIGLIFFPLFSKAASEGDFQYIKKTIDKFEKFSFLFIMPVVIFLSLYSDVIIKLLLGVQYLNSIPIMTIINLAMFLMVLNMPYGNVITGMGFFKLSAIINLLNLFLFAILILILPNPKIFNLGATGVAITVFVSNLFIGCLYRFFAKQKCSILSLKMSARFAVFGIINFFGFYFIYSNLSKVYGTNFKIAFVIIYFVITYLILLILGWIKKEDVHNLKTLINISKMGSYIKEELKRK
jgi:O-antigen/teichoic acid export membrane protein